jgi:hypothetical protein
MPRHDPATARVPGGHPQAAGLTCSGIELFERRIGNSIVPLRLHRLARLSLGYQAFDFVSHLE